MSVRKFVPALIFAAACLTARDDELVADVPSAAPAAGDGLPAVVATVADGRVEPIP